MPQSARIQTPSLAKLSTPRLGKIYPRKRLFKLLDKARDQPIVWLSAPAGYGKTTLVASYLKTKKLDTLWYQVDEGDGDLASFFYYLGLAGNQAAPEKPPLPLLTPEYQAGLSTYCRNFFRELFGRIKAPGVLVLDNYQDAPADSSLHELLAVGLNEIPEGISVIILSRVEPPAPMARLRTSNAMNILQQKDIALDEIEGKGILALRKGKSTIKQGFAQQLIEFTHGWVAGLVLLSEQEHDIQLSEGLDTQLDQSTVFDYFAGEIFSRTDSSAQTFLMMTAYINRFSVETATQLTGIPETNKILEQLTQKNYFTYRHAGKPVFYEYHPLFQHFLRVQAEQKFTDAEIRVLRHQAALLLEEQARLDEAAECFLANKDWQELSRIITTHGESLASQGRYTSLVAWLKAIPEATVRSSPWLLYWSAVCKQKVGIETSRQLFAEALELFKKNSDPIGAYLSWSGAVDSFQYHGGDYSLLDFWIDEFDQLQTLFPKYPDINIEAKAVYGMLSAMIWRKPEYDKINIWVTRSEAMLRADINPLTRLMIANLLILYYAWRIGDIKQAGMVLRVTQPLVEAIAGVPLVQLLWHTMEGAYYSQCGKFELALEAIHNGLQIAEDSGVYATSFLLHVQGAYCNLGAQRFDDAKCYLDKLPNMIAPTALGDQAHYHHVMTWYALVGKDLPDAERHIKISGDYVFKCGAVMGVIIVEHTMGFILAEKGEYEAARPYLLKTQDWADKLHSGLLAFHTQLTLAWIDLIQDHKDSARQRLQKIFKLGREMGYISHPWIGWRHDIMVQLYQFALEHDIETKYVQDVILKRGLVPDVQPLHLDNWPWLIRIFTLGRFTLMVNNEPVKFTGKVKSKPLDLLKALIALGGREVSEDKLGEALWPDADGDAARQSVSITVHRLRKLLGTNEAILRVDAKISLNPRYCWVDAQAFEQLLEKTERARQGNDLDSLVRYSKQALVLYSGDFLASEAEQSWALVMQERLRSKYLRHTQVMGEQFRKNGDWEQAVDCYLTALDVDPCAESLYQNLMRCYQQQNKRAEGLNIYERCQRTLLSHLGIDPSQETQRLYQILRGNQKS